MGYLSSPMRCKQDMTCLLFARLMLEDKERWEIIPILITKLHLWIFACIPCDDFYDIFMESKGSDSIFI